MSRRSAVLAWLTTPTLLASLFVALAGMPARAAGTIDYVALGDSYAAGLGTPGSTGVCGRSPAGYPQLWAAAHQLASFQSVACSGATTTDVRGSQLAALAAGTDLVTVTVGGNDAGFAPAVASCVLLTDSACAGVVNVARSYITDVLPIQLDWTYAAIRQRSPQARVVVLAYPRLFDVSGACPGGLSLAKRRSLNSGADDLATVTRARAAAAGFTFVEVRAPFAGHGICAGAPWVNTLSVRRPTDSFHPNTAGYASGYLPVLTAAVG